MYISKTVEFGFTTLKVYLSIKRRYAASLVSKWAIDSILFPFKQNTGLNSSSKEYFGLFCVCFRSVTVSPF